MSKSSQVEIDGQPVEVIRENIGTPGETFTLVFSSHPFKQNSRHTFLASELRDLRQVLNGLAFVRSQERSDRELGLQPS